MAKHKLGLHIEDTYNKEIMKISDISIYAQDLSVSCQELLIQPPGYPSAFLVSVPNTPNFTKVATACEIGLQTRFCESQFDIIPDGVYAIKYSVAPQQNYYVEYNHFRTSCLLERIKHLYAGLNICGLENSPAKKGKIQKIKEAEAYLSIAKYTAEISLEPERATTIYAAAEKLVEKLECENCN